MKSKLLWGAALSLVCLLGLAIGQEVTTPGAAPGDAGTGMPPPPPPFFHPPNPLLATLDADQDGIISAEEIAGASAALATLDTNGDGSLTRDELRPPPPAGAPPRGSRGGDPADHIMRLDADGSGGVSLKEFSAPAAAAFSKMDADGDGNVTFDEFNVPATEAFARIDTSGDGQIDADEAAAAPPPPPRHACGRGGPGGPGGPPPGCGGPDAKTGPKGKAATGTPGPRRAARR